MSYDLEPVLLGQVEVHLFNVGEWESKALELVIGINETFLVED